MDPTPDATETTRRSLLAAAGAITATALAGCNGTDLNTPTASSADDVTATDATDTSPTGMTATDAPNTTSTDTATPEPVGDDVPLLNYALTLEHLENAFYREGLNTYSDEELMGADALSTFGDHVRMQVPDHLRVVGDHEAAHVTAITDTINDLGGTPVSEANYDFGYSTPSEFLGVAKALENTGVAAYKGAAPTVSNDDVFAAAIGIHSVEARHASFLNELNGTSPFPNGVDKPKTMDEVTEIAGQFIVEE